MFIVGVMQVATHLPSGRLELNPRVLAKSKKIMKFLSSVSLLCDVTVL